MRILILLLLTACAASPIEVVPEVTPEVEKVVEVSPGSFSRGAKQPTPKAFKKMCAKYPKPKACP